jgi:hypothetical protein
MAWLRDAITPSRIRFARTCGGSSAKSTRSAWRWVAWRETDRQISSASVPGNSKRPAHKTAELRAIEDLRHDIAAALDESTDRQRAALDRVATLWLARIERAGRKTVAPGRGDALHRPWQPWCSRSPLRSGGRCSSEIANRSALGAAGSKKPRQPINWRAAQASSQSSSPASAVPPKSPSPRSSSARSD